MMIENKKGFVVPAVGYERKARAVRNVSTKPQLIHGNISGEFNRMKSAGWRSVLKVNDIGIVFVPKYYKHTVISVNAVERQKRHS